MTAQQQIAMTSFASKVVGKPFEWGNTDCCSLAIDCFDHIRGTNYKQGELVKSIKDKESALKLCEERTALEILNQNNFVEIPLSEASKGDIIYFFTEGFESINICYGESCLSSSEENGVRFTATKVVLKFVKDEGRCFRWKQ